MRYFLALFCCVAIGPARADELQVRSGTLFLVKPLAAVGKAGGAVLSADGKTAYFTRQVADPEPAKQWDGEPNQICRVSVPGGTIEPLVEPAGSSEPERNLRGFGSLTLSPDGRTLFFISAAWATSGAVHSVNLTTGAVSYVSPGNELMVIPHGEYRGDLVVQKHKYLVGNGSYDQYWVVTPDGKELGLAGRNTGGRAAPAEVATAAPPATAASLSTALPPSRPAHPQRSCSSPCPACRPA